jgi:hypothetical protein
VLDFRELLFPAPMLLQKYFYGKKTIFNYSPEIYLQQKKKNYSFLFGSILYSHEWCLRNVESESRCSRTLSYKISLYDE